MGSYIGTNFHFTMKKGCISHIEKATKKKKNRENTNIVRIGKKKCNPSKKAKEKEKESTMRRKRPRGLFYTNIFVKNIFKKNKTIYPMTTVQNAHGITTIYGLDLLARQYR